MVRKRRKKAEEHIGINIFEHKWVPKARVLSEEEKEKLLKKYNISEFQLPKILKSDPMVKALGAKVGDVIEIIRDSPTAGKSIYYRVVIDEI